MLALVSFIGISRMAQINASLDQVMEERWPRAQMAGRHRRAGANTIAIALRNMMRTNTPGSCPAETTDRCEPASSLGIDKNCKRVVLCST